MSNLSKQIAKDFRELYFGGNWTSSNVKDSLADVTWEQAITKIKSFNTIATLVYHTHYYVVVVLKVLQGKPLEAKDEYSFEHPPIESKKDWETMLHTTFEDAEKFATRIEQLPEETLFKTMSDEKYGTYYRNIQGIIEHTYYHLGQIVILKKIILERELLK